MAIAEANCTCERCGKAFEVRVKRRNRAEANDFKMWAERNITVCRECEQRTRDAEHQEAAALAAVRAKERGWPDLTGSDRQIVWALQIREDVYNKAQQCIAEEERQGMYPADEIEEIKARYSAVIADAINAHTSAAWWIDHRDDSLYRIFVPAEGGKK